MKTITLFMIITIGASACGVAGFQEHKPFPNPVEFLLHEAQETTKEEVLFILGEPISIIEKRGFDHWTYHMGPAHGNAIYIYIFRGEELTALVKNRGGKILWEPGSRDHQ